MHISFLQVLNIQFKQIKSSLPTYWNGIVHIFKLYIKNNHFVSVKNIILLLAGSVSFFACQTPKKQAPYTNNHGKAQGTYYTATYQHPEGKDLQAEIDAFFAAFDLSLSTYNPNSVISKINRNEDSIQIDTNFETMFTEAQRISEITNGAFDITVGPLVKAWGFGFNAADRSKIPNVDSLLPLTGYNKVKLESGKIIKQNSAIILDASAIAQGLSADLIGQLFEKHGCKNYMIDIGGEIFCKGVNPKGMKWQIGIDKPVDDPTNMNRELQIVISVSGVGLTTSGNYRQFYYQGDKKYAHTINPLTGFPVEHNLLSATVIAPTAMQADAFATAFMVLGVDSSLTVCRDFDGMECYLIYSDHKGNYNIAMTDGFRKYLNE